MAENSTSGMVESIQLKLETNFDKVLEKTAARYGDFFKDTSNISKGIQDSFSKMNNHILTNISGITTQTSNEIVAAMNNARGAMNKIVSQGIRLNEYYLQSLDKLSKKSNDLKNKLGQDYIIKRTKIATSDLKDSQKEKEFENLNRQYESDMANVKAGIVEEYARVGNEINKRIGSMAARANENLVQNAEASSRAVISTIEKTRSKLKQFESTTGMMSSVGEISGYQKQLIEFKKQQKAIEEAKKAAAINEAESVKNVQKAKGALAEQGDDKLLKKNTEYFEQSVKANTELKKKYQELSDSARAFGKDVEALDSKTKALAANLQKNIKDSVKNLNLKSDFERNTKALEDVAKATGSNINTALYKKEESQRSIQEKVNQLQEFKKQALELQKTGLVDTSAQIKAIDTVLSKHKQYIKEYKQDHDEVIDYVRNKLKTQKNIPALIDMSKSFKNVEDSFNKLKGMGRVTGDNFIEVSARLKQVEGDYNKYVESRKKVYKNLQRLQDEFNKIEEKKTKTTNKNLLKEYEEYQNKLLSNIKRLQAEIDKVRKPFKTSDITKELSVEAESIQKKLSDKFLIRPTWNRTDFDDIRNKYNELIILSTKLSSKRILSKGAASQAISEFNKLNDSIKLYRQNAEELITTIRRLETIQRSGLGTPEIASNINKLKTQLNEIRSVIPDLNRRASQAQREIDKLTRKSMKSVTGSIMEGVRNFRWQHAAIMYFATEAVQITRRHIEATLNEIQQFRTSAMSIAASVTMQMVGDTKENYKVAYEFSRDLMQKLEIQAAQSILTLEDLLMLTKTVTQAGIIPKTDKDIDNLNTIGVGIKALTEGMANAGVQMRQELNALILGRQRVVDQVATMFKLQGVDIQKLIDEGKKQGKDMVTVLAEAMSGFKAMGDAMKDEYSVARNELDTIWKLIKRIGVEPVLLEVAKTIRSISSSLYDMNTKILTPLGKDIAVSIGAAFETILVVVKEIVKTATLFFNLMGSIFGIVFELVSPFMDVNNYSEEISGRAKTILGTMQSIGVATIYFNHSLRLVLNTTLGVLNSLRSIGSYMTAFSSPSSAMEIWNGAELFPKLDAANAVFNEAKQNFKDVGNASTNAKKDVNDFKQAMIDISHHVANSGKKVKATIIDNLSVPFREVIQEQEELNKLADKYEVKAASKADRPKVEFKQLKEERDAYGKKVEANIKYLESKLHEYESKQGNLDGKLADSNQKAISQIKTQIDGYKDLLNTNNAIISSAKQKMNNSLADVNSRLGKQTERLRNQTARALREYKSFLIELEDRPETRAEKTEQWKGLMREKIEELKVTNAFARKNAGLIEEAFAKGLANRLKQDMEEIEELRKSFDIELTGHRLLDPLSKINNEIDNVMKKIWKSEDIMADPKLVQHFQDLEEATRKERIELEKFNMELERRASYLDVLSGKAQYMQNSFSPIENREGEILNLAIEYEKQAEQIKAKLREIDMMWKENGRWIQKEGVDIVRGYSENMQMQLDEMTKATEREISRKQAPLWNDLTEASKSWADGLSDSLSQLVLDFDNFGASFKNLQQTILSDTVKAVMRRKLVEPLMDILGDGSGEQTKSGGTMWERLKSNIGGIFGFGSEDTSGNSDIQGILGSNAATPMYVCVTNALQVPDVSGKIGETTKAIVDSSDEMTNVFSRGFQSMASIFNSVVSGNFAGLANSIGGGLGMLGGLFNIFPGFSGGGMNTGAPAHIGAGLTTAFGMKEGGEITEHIIGRGMRSNKIYEFGEDGVTETVIPNSKIKHGGSNGDIHVHMAINQQNIDTQSGVDFLLKNSSVIETGIIRALKSNKKIRSAIKSTR